MSEFQELTKLENLLYNIDEAYDDNDFIKKNQTLRQSQIEILRLMRALQWYANCPILGINRKAREALEYRESPK